MNGDDDVTSKPNGFIFVIPPFSGVMITLNGRMLAATQIHTDRYMNYREEKKGLQILLSYSWQGQAEKLSRARKKYLATTYQPFFLGSVNIGF